MHPFAFSDILVDIKNKNEFILCHRINFQDYKSHTDLELYILDD